MSDIKEEQKRLYKKAEENDIKLLQEENKRLKDLCDKYEEEHNTTFIEWQKDIKANKKAIEYIEENKQLSRFADLRKDGVHNYDLECDADDLLNILKGDNK